MENGTEGEKSYLEDLVKKNQDDVDMIDSQIKALQETRKGLMKSLRANTSKLVTLTLRDK